MHYAQSLHKNEREKSYLPNPLFLYFAILFWLTYEYEFWCHQNWINSCIAGNLKMRLFSGFKPLWKSWRWQMHRCISYFCAKTNTTRKPTEQKIKKLTQQAQLGSFSYFCFWVSNKHTCAISNWNSVVLSNVQVLAAILKIISSNLPNIK